MAEAGGKAVRLVIQPNASMSHRSARHLLFAIAAVMFAIAGWYTAAGFWPVMLFAVVNMLGVTAAVMFCLRGNAYREVLRFDGDLLEIECGFIGRGSHLKETLVTHATRAVIEPGPYPTSPTRLILSCDTRRIEIGHLLTDTERTALCERIWQILQPGWQRPIHRTIEKKAAWWVQ
ncbi:MAG TPA: DUF2244 domain-containing protein [Nevskiaceae bacterium]|nr:DUF2244 domain-containing protein [Nevskiaceae bacterium]